MKYLAIALSICGIFASLSYCTVQETKGRNEYRMWCSQHGGEISGWTNNCIMKTQPTVEKSE